MTLSLYQRHVKKWRNCRRCDLHEQRRRVCLARGRVPCDVLFVGEAPGVSEDVLGSPFVGPAGKLLDYIINISLDGQYDYCLTNLVGCFPKKAKEEGLNEPSKGQIQKCGPRLDEFMALCKPDIVVAVGKLAAKHLGEVADSSITHPAAILRLDVSQKGLAIQRATVIVENLVK